MKTELSFEVFPPKSSDGIERIYACLDRLSEFKPAFISVTYSAGNAKKGLTGEVCGHIKEKYGIDAVSHLTCTNATEEAIKGELRYLKSKNVDTVLALRGDITPEKPVGVYGHATDLMKAIADYGGFKIFGSCYPDVHVESGSRYDDLFTLKAKYDLGVRKFISQLFLDNASFLRLRDEGKRICPSASFSAGIMPVLSQASVYRMITLSGAKMTSQMRAIVDKYGSEPAAMRSAGIEYAIEQIIGLVKEGVDDIHLYTMCRADVTEEIYRGIKGILQ